MRVVHANGGAKKYSLYRDTFCSCHYLRSYGDGRYSASPFFAAESDVTSSGSEVPNATIVRPIRLSLIPKPDAIVFAPLTTRSGGIAMLIMYVGYFAWIVAKDFIW